MHDMLGFHTAEQWLDRLDAIPHGISIKNWKKSNVEIPMGTTQKHMKRIYYHYQGVEEVIRFLLGHRPFEKNLTYAPIRLYSATGSRVYSELHTADWWWDMQAKVPNGATVVPVLIGIDKTVLTEHQGDLAAWPIYLTIGNLDSRTRRSQNRPSLILVGFMPIVKNKKVSRTTRAEVYHAVLGRILKRMLS